MFDFAGKIKYNKDSGWHIIFEEVVICKTANAHFLKKALCIR